MDPDPASRSAPEHIREGQREEEEEESIRIPEGGVIQKCINAMRFAVRCYAPRRYEMRMMPIGFGV